MGSMGKILPENPTMSGSARDYFSGKKFGTANSFRRYMKRHFNVDYEYHNASATLNSLITQGFLSRLQRGRKGLFVLSGYNRFPSEEDRLTRRNMVLEAGRRYRMKMIRPAHEEEEMEEKEERPGLEYPQETEDERTRELYEVLRELDQSS